MAADPEPLAPGRRRLSIHPQAQRGFGRAAQAYERGRTEYPQSAIDWLCRQLDLQGGRTVIDVGAGTGKLTRALTPTGARLMAIEPVPAMRSMLERRVPSADILSGRAEEIPLGSGSVAGGVRGRRAVHSGR